MNDTAAVELVNITKRFNDVVAVDDLSLTIRDGEFFSLLGASGCGKTTSLRMIAGFELPSSGSVYIGGTEQGYLPPYKRPVNTVFQHYALFPHLSVAQNVGFGMSMLKESRREIQRRTAEALDMVHLTGMENRLPAQLSGGQQQRVALARALVNHPKVLLLDEPLGALDMKLRKAMQVELKNLQHRVGITFIYVTHDQEEALTMSDRIAVMNRGKIVQMGSPQEIYEEPKNLFVADFIGETNLIPGTLLAVRPVITVRLDGGKIIIAGWGQDDLRAGERVKISVRPESLSLFAPGQAGADDSSLLNVRVQGVIYSGDTTRFLLELDAHTMLSASRHNNPGNHQAGLQVGETVLVKLDTPRVRVLRA